MTCTNQEAFLLGIYFVKTVHKVNHKGIPSTKLKAKAGLFRLALLVSVRVPFH